MKELEQILKVLADRNRMRIIKLLEQRKMCVCELTYILGIKQPSVSRHLKKLREAGLIQEEKNGYWKDYYLTKRSGSYAQLLTKSFKSWLNDDPVIKVDLSKLNKAKRELLCCK